MLPRSRWLAPCCLVAACTGSAPTTPPDADPCPVHEAGLDDTPLVDAAVRDVAIDTADGGVDAFVATVALLPLPGYIDARTAPCSARGDGVTDDTAAIQCALDAAGRFMRSSTGAYINDSQPGHGGVAYLAPGNYLVRGHLEVPPFVTLRGAYVRPTGAFDAATAGLSNAVLLAVADAGHETGRALLDAAAGATVEGLTIYYPEQTDTNPPVAYPWAINEAGLQVSVLDVVLVNAYQGINAGSTASGRHLVRGVTGQPLRAGLLVDYSLDTGRIEDVHFTPMWRADAASPARVYQQTHGIAFDVRRGDWEQMRDVSATGYSVGLSLGVSPTPCLSTGLCGGANALVTDATFESTDVGVEITSGAGSSGVHIDRMTYTAPATGAHRVAIWHPASLPSMLMVSHLTTRGAYAQAVAWDTGLRFTLDASTIGAWDPTRPAIQLHGGSVIVRGTTFAAGSGVAVAAAGSAHAIAVDNVLHGHSLTGTTVASGNTP